MLFHAKEIHHKEFIFEGNSHKKGIYSSGDPGWQAVRIACHLHEFKCVK